MALPLRLRQFVVAVGGRGGERAFAGEGTGGYGAGGERRATDAWRMLARSMPKTANSGERAVGVSELRVGVQTKREGSHR